MKKTGQLYFEDLAVGQTFESGTVTVEPEMIRAFASEFDAQPFHLDEEASRGSLFDRMVASGWHTASLTNRLFVEGSLQIAGGLIGVGVEELRWPRPVYPGDTLRVVSVIVGLRRSRSRDDRGLVSIRLTTLNQEGQLVLEQVVVIIVPCRSS
jgi:acyl dehydratase